MWTKAAQYGKKLGIRRPKNKIKRYEIFMLSTYITSISTCKISSREGVFERIGGGQMQTHRGKSWAGIDLKLAFTDDAI